jgi:hypothetical protein
VNSHVVPRRLVRQHDGAVKEFPRDLYENDGSKAAGFRDAARAARCGEAYPWGPRRNGDHPRGGGALVLPQLHLRARRRGDGAGPGGSVRCDSACHAKTIRTALEAVFTPPWGARPRDVLLYVHATMLSPRARTQAFHAALFSSTLPAYVPGRSPLSLAISSRRPRAAQANGNMWAWEGCFPTCWGWTALMHARVEITPRPSRTCFPPAKRTLREQEYSASQRLRPRSARRGHVTFRSALPYGPTSIPSTPPRTGTGRGAMKATCDTHLRRPRLRGALFPGPPAAPRLLHRRLGTDPPGRAGEPHHNTTTSSFGARTDHALSFYLGRLGAWPDHQRLESARGARLAGPGGGITANLGPERGLKYMDSTCSTACITSRRSAFMAPRASPEQDLAALREAPTRRRTPCASEGPKYQNGAGCASPTRVCGAWMAGRCGVESYQTASISARNLKSITSPTTSAQPEGARQHPAPRTPRLGDEARAVLCTWPRGGKPTLPSATPRGVDRIERTWWPPT